MLYKPSACKINKDNVATIDNTDTYYTVIKPTELNPKIINNLINKINKLDKEDHKKIYIFLRTNGLDSDIFSYNNTETYCDFYSIPLKLQKELFTFVELLIDDNNRNKYIETLIK